MIKALPILLILSTLLSLSSTCQHDNFQKPVRHFPEPLLHEPSSGDRMLAFTTNNIRIVAYYYLDNFSSRIQTAISEQILPAAITYYQKALKVKPLTSKIPVTRSYTDDCAKVDAPNGIDSVTADLVLLVTATADTSSNYIAAARACWIEKTTNRPTMGHIQFNTAFGFADDTEFNFRNQIYTTLHEMGHILGFSSGLYDYYIDPNTNKKLSQTSPVTKTKTVNGVPVTVLMLEPLTSKLKDYFDCEDVEGAYIEQQGGSGSAGSHFERRIFMNEFMTASSVVDSRVSIFFLALLEGTGWYFPDESLAEPMFWGKGLGCDFLDTKCITTSKTTDFPTHYCTKLDVDSCTFSNEAYGVCGTNQPTNRDSSLNSNFNYFGNKITVLDSFADNCPYYYSYSLTECQDSSNSAISLPGGEYFGEGSSCFTGTLNSFGTKTPFCFKKTCEQDISGDYSIKVKVGSTTVTCTEEESISVSGYSGTLNCPDPKTFCTTSGATYCPRGCMGKGTCNNGVCTCDPGYSGSDCSFAGVMSFSEQKSVFSIDRGTSEASSSSESTGKIIIYAAIGAGAVAIIAVVALLVSRYRRAKARKAAAQRSSQSRPNKQNKQARQNNYAVNENNARSQQPQQPNYVDPRGINVGIAQQQHRQMYAMPQQQVMYANNMNPQMQGNMAYYPNNNNNGHYYTGAPQQGGHRVQIPQ